MKRYRLFAVVVALLLNFMLIFQVSVVYGSSNDSIRLESLEKEIWEMARELSLSTYQGFPGKAPESLSNLSYDQWRDIRFKPEKSVWLDKNLPFQIRFYHLGFLYDVPVRINLVTSKGIKEFRYDPDLFDYGKNSLPVETYIDIGFAGFRIHYPLNRPDYHDELISFLGASYFRALGKNQRYGISARGLAIDTALPTGEEFPYFNALHRGFIRKKRSISRDVKTEIATKVLGGDRESLTKDEAMKLLRSPALLFELHKRIWESPKDVFDKWETYLNIPG